MARSSGWPGRQDGPVGLAGRKQSFPFVRRAEDHLEPNPDFAKGQEGGNDEGADELRRAGETTTAFEEDQVQARLAIAGRTVLTLRARVGRERLGTLSGYSIDYAEREAKTGGREVARPEIRWVSDAFAADDPMVEFSFGPRESALAAVGSNRPRIEAVSFRRTTLVPYLTHYVLK